MAAEHKEREQKGKDVVESLNDLHWLYGPFLPGERSQSRIGFEFQCKRRMLSSGRMALYPAQYIPALLVELKGADMVVGARVGKNVKIPLMRRPAKGALTIPGSKNRFGSERAETVAPMIIVKAPFSTTHCGSAAELKSGSELPAQGTHKRKMFSYGGEIPCYFVQEEDFDIGFAVLQLSRLIFI